MGTQAKHHLAPRVRGAFLKALEIIEDDQGLTFSELMVREIETHGLLAVMEKVARYQERVGTVVGKIEHDHAHQHTHEHQPVSNTDRWLGEVLGEHQKISSEESRPQ